MNIKSPREVSVFSSGQKAHTEYAEPVNTPPFESLASSFLSLAEHRLSDMQKTVLVMSAKVLEYHDLTVTALADHMSRRSHVPYSTLKWNLRLLTKMGLLVGGDTKNRGRKASLTEAARLLIHHLEDRAIS
ncbi:MAG: hypothetical protein JSW61_11565 [Candidatus Thorarchaeota archaeon]|nr:MAG: hypothetical protein JSW61_11565 [Candidatus Thorarchaeota archaeon]